MMDIEIRRVQPGDEKDLAYIQTESWKSAFAHILDADTLHRLTNTERCEEMYRSLLAADKGNGYILTLDGKPHCIAYWDEARDASMKGMAELICIHSLPDNWHKGFGSTMMDHVLKDVKEAGYSDIMLWVFTENIRARAFYEAKGFRASDIVKPALGADEICYIRRIL